MDKSNQANDGKLQMADLDLEWVYLLLKAKKAGINASDIRQFFNEKSLQAM